MLQSYCTVFRNVFTCFDWKIYYSYSIPTLLGPGLDGADGGGTGCPGGGGSGPGPAAGERVAGGAGQAGA